MQKYNKTDDIYPTAGALEHIYGMQHDIMLVLASNSEKGGDKSIFYAKVGECQYDC